MWPEPAATGPACYRHRRPTADLDEPIGAPPGTPTPATATPWWKQAVFYQIYPRSFADSDGDGIGDLAGIRAHLADLAWLGVDALWLSPFYRSPMVDFGYDVSDYCDVDPTFGTLDDFDRLVDDAHALGMRVIIDWVPNHTSDQHPWFTDARRAPEQAPQLVRLARRRARTAPHPTIGWRHSICPHPPGPSTRPPASGTSTCSTQASPT